MPADTPRCVRLRRLLAGLQPCYQRERRRLRVSDDRNATNIAVRRRDVDGAIKAHNSVGDCVHVVDPHISYPSRRSAHSPRVWREVHETAHRHPSNNKLMICEISRGRVLCSPAQNLAIKGLGRGHVGRQELVPDETAMMIGHVCSSVRAHRQSHRNIHPCTSVYRSRDGSWKLIIKLKWCGLVALSLG